jgi:hypothetical protein
MGARRVKGTFNFTVGAVYDRVSMIQKKRRS